MRFCHAAASRCSASAALCSVRACASAFSAATALARACPVCSVTSRASSVINTSPARTRSPALTRMPAIVATIRLEIDADSRAATTPPASSRSAVSIVATGATVTGIGSAAFAWGRSSPLPQADRPPATTPSATIPISRFMAITSLAPRASFLEPPERTIERHGLENHVHFGGCGPRLCLERRLGGSQHVGHCGQPALVPIADDALRLASLRQGGASGLFSSRARRRVARARPRTSTSMRRSTRSRSAVART